MFSRYLSDVVILVFLRLMCGATGIVCVGGGGGLTLWWLLINGMKIERSEEKKILPCGRRNLRESKGH